MFHNPLFIMVTMPCCGDTEYLRFSRMETAHGREFAFYEGEHGDKVQIRLSVSVPTEDHDNAIRELRFDKGGQGKPKEDGRAA